MVEQPLPRQGDGHDGRSAELADAGGHPVHGGRRRRLASPTACDVEAGLAESVERHGVQVGEGGGQLRPEGPPVLGRGGEVGEVLARLARRCTRSMTSSVPPSSPSPTSAVLHLVGEERARHRDAAVVVDGPQDGELVRRPRLRATRPAGPCARSRSAGSSVGARERDQDGLLGPPAGDDLHRRHREFGRGRELVGADRRSAARLVTEHSDRRGRGVGLGLLVEHGRVAARRPARGSVARRRPARGRAGPPPDSVPARVAPRRPPPGGGAHRTARA